MRLPVPNRLILLGISRLLVQSKSCLLFFTEISWIFIQLKNWEKTFLKLLLFSDKYSKWVNIFKKWYFLLKLCIFFNHIIAVTANNRTICLPQWDSLHDFEYPFQLLKFVKRLSETFNCAQNCFQNACRKCHFRRSNFQMPSTLKLQGLESLHYFKHLLDAHISVRFRCIHV